MGFNDYNYDYNGPSYTGRGWYIFQGHALNGGTWWNNIYDQRHYYRSSHSNSIIFKYEN